MNCKQKVYLELIKETKRQAIELQNMHSDDSIVILDTKEEAGFSFFEQDSMICKLVIVSNVICLFN